MPVRFAFAVRCFFATNHTSLPLSRTQNTHPLSLSLLFLSSYFFVTPTSDHASCKSMSCRHHHLHHAFSVTLLCFRIVHAYSLAFLCYSTHPATICYIRNSHTSTSMRKKKYMDNLNECMRTLDSHSAQQPPQPSPLTTNHYVCFLDPSDNPVASLRTPVHGNTPRQDPWT